jgi:hypothetical protein
VAFKGKEGVIAQHAAAIIRDANEASAGIFHVNTNLSGTRVEGILEKLFDDGGGPLHHFAGSDLIGNVVGENLDPAHSIQYRGQKKSAG